MDDQAIRGIRETLASYVMEEVSAIVKDANRRLDPAADRLAVRLKEGWFYPSVYLKLLETAANEEPQSSSGAVVPFAKRLQWMRTNRTDICGWMPKEYFQKVRSVATPLFKIKPGIKPSEALKAAKTGLTLLSCRELCQVAQWGAVERYLGEERFNALFHEQSKRPLNIGVDVDHLSLAILRKDLTGPYESDPVPLEKGDVVVLTKRTHGVPLIQYLNGAMSYYAVCVDNQSEAPKYVTLGVAAEGGTFDDMRRALLKRVSTASEAAIEALDVKTVVGGLEGKVFRLDAEFLQQLKDSPLEDAQKLLESRWYFHHRLQVGPAQPSTSGEFESYMGYGYCGCAVDGRW